MKNLKIKVNGNIDELVDLFKQLGCKYFNHTGSVFNYMFFENGGVYFCKLKKNFDESECKEITLPQLRDKVVLHRNDVRDATHEGRHRTGYLSSDGVEYLFNYVDREWFICTSLSFASQNMIEINPIKKDKDMENLISEKEALIALANGEKVLIRNHHWDNFDDLTQDFSLNVFFMGEYEFKLKPRTIKIGDVDVPAPFEPNDGERYLYIKDNSTFGFGCCEYDKGDEDCKIQFGAWRTESEIKQVVAALRKLIGVAK